MALLMETIDAHWLVKISIEGGRYRPRHFIQSTGMLSEWSEISIESEILL